MATPDHHRLVPGKAPARGSFPLDHFDDCTEIKTDYVRCLKQSMHDSLSCRHLSKSYLQCRMDHELMFSESMEQLGFAKDEKDGWIPPRERGEMELKQRGVEGGHVTARADTRWWNPVGLWNGKTTGNFYDELYEGFRVSFGFGRSQKFTG